jgi:hypothetical protein
LKVSNSSISKFLVLQRTKDELFKGKNTVRSLGRTFTVIDANHDRLIDKQEFYWGLKNLGCSLSIREAA